MNKVSSFLLAAMLISSFAGCGSNAGEKTAVYSEATVNDGNGNTWIRVVSDEDGRAKMLALFDKASAGSSDTEDAVGGIERKFSDDDGVLDDVLNILD
jgi:hypothetical protein